MKNITKYLLIGIGTISVGLGVLGMFLPLLPTTPFLLLAAICYGHSSERFYHWLTTNRFFGDYIRNYREGRGIPLKQKIFTITLLWMTIGYSILFIVPLWWVKLLLGLCAAGVTIHLVRVKTFKQEKTTFKALDAEEVLPKG